ncbi:MAG: MBL fold metallo-hydrolase [Candidatus Aminicenantes bacterium]|nr:MBL fold metallo-hydrolase [Candidatus Aminicenantes bacterium]
MKRLLALSTVLIAILTVFLSAADDAFRVTRLGEKAALFQVGREASINITVLASRRGLVVIDTGLLPSRGAALRSAIEREFARRDFAYVINTHAHFDHTDGNQAFADVPIVGHQNAAREMSRWLGSPAAVDAFLESRAGYQKELEAELKTAAAGTRDERRVREQLPRNAALMDDFRQGRFVLTKPTVMFSDRLTIDLGDLTLNLIYFGRAHIESDILVHIPALRLLAVGDLFGKDWLPGFANPQADVPRWFEALDGLPGGLQTLERVIGGHGEPMSGDDLRAQVAYLREIWDGVAAARRDGLTLAATKERLPFDEKSPFLSGLSRMGRQGQGPDRHLVNIEAAWRLQSESAARALESLIASRGLEEGVAEYRQTIAGNGRYNVAEDELNALGYRYLQSGRTAEAIAVFEINAEAFPRSWNVWDSLAEAHLAREEQDKAEEFYEKSVELNPDNQNGRNQLSIIRGNRLELAAETKETLRFDAGSRTGLQGPYLGQKSPGLKPEIFAPGIVSSAKALEFAATFTPDGREMYFTRRIDGGQNTIMVSRWEKEGWTAPEEAAFAKGSPSNEPFITPDGRKLYFGCNRTRPGADRPEWAIWVVERTASGAWGEPRYHGLGMFVSAAGNGNLYMTDVAGIVSPDRPVVVYPWTGDGYGAPQRLGGGVNSPAVADHGFIAPDESYVLFDSPHRPGGQGGYGDLYVCFRNPDGSWGEAINLGNAINGPASNFCPSVSPDGKSIFYGTYRDIYWVSAKVIDDLRPKKQK